MPRSQFYPRPRRWKQARYASTMSGLTEQQRTELQDAVAELWAAKMDHRKTWRGQDPEVLEDFMDEVLYMCPFLRHFQDGWPAEGLMRHRLERFRIKSPNDAKVQSKHTEPRRMPTRARKVEEAGSDEERVPVDNPTVLKHHTTPPGRASLARSMTAVDCDLSNTLEIVQFLSQLTPDLSRLTSKVLESGVRTVADLAGLAAMPTHELNAFLRDELRLNPFEATVVRVGVIRRYSALR